MHVTTGPEEKQVKPYPPDRPCTVYFMWDGFDKVKIGLSRSVSQRKRHLERKESISLVVLALMHNVLPFAERSYHEELRHWKVSGEWFLLTTHLLRIAKSVALSDRGEVFWDAIKAAHERIDSREVLSSADERANNPGRLKPMYRQKLPRELIGRQ